MIKKVETTEQFNDLLQNDNRFFLLKHSLTCPISQAAYQEYNKFADAHQEVNTYYLAVQEARPLSNDIAEKFQIKHESPQVILISNGEALWNASHWKITNRSLENALSENS